jgi:hypothetical protein
MEKLRTKRRGGNFLDIHPGLCGRENPQNS